MTLRIHNTLTRRKEDFVPLQPGEARVYVCGVTPYDLSHVGHARSALVFDVVRRYLAFTGYRVTFVRNFTDVEDKIIRRAAEQGVAPEALAARYIEAYRADMAALDVLPPDVEPLATAHVLPEPGKPYRMVSLVERLVAAGVAYVVDGDVYFEVRRFPSYGRLSGRNLDELLVGARVDVDERKRDPRDFVLWKAAKPGEPAWPSPWGPGRPGWHIECSAMAMEYLGETLDLHGGGEDLVFPHHEGEIAQSEAVTARPFARCWIHNGLVNLGAEKMSKSLGNTLTTRDLVTRHDPAAVRLYLLGTHYRNPVEFAEDRIPEAGRALERLRRLVDVATALDPTEPGADAELDEAAQAARAQFTAAMDDDFNTPQALAALFDLSRTLHSRADAVRGAPARHRPFREAVDVLWTLAGVLGLRRRGLASSPAAGDADPWAAKVQRLVAERDAARRRRDWARADAIRAELEAEGVVIEDHAAGSRWTRRSVPRSV